MRLFVWRWFVVSSVIVAALGRAAETRPQYGGVLHIAMRAAPTSFDPADRAQPDSFAHRNLSMLMFDTLLTTDENGRIQPSLASAMASVAGQPALAVSNPSRSHVSRWNTAHRRECSRLSAYRESVMECGCGSGLGDH